MFDMCQLYPHNLSWTLQLVQLFKLIGVDIGHDIASISRHLDELHDSTRGPDLVSFLFIQHTEDKTLSFFRLMPDVSVAVSFRKFLSGCSVDCQNFLLLFLTSGLRWRFFADSH